MAVCSGNPSTAIMRCAAVVPVSSTEKNITERKGCGGRLRVLGEGRSGRESEKKKGKARTQVFVL